MPHLSVRSPNDVPRPSRASRAVREQQSLYDNFIRDVGDQVGELDLQPDESIRSVKVRLRRSAARLGLELDVWDVNSRVYFRVRARRSRASRPRAL